MRRVTIASGSQLAADAGAAIADIGGNAVDAAIAAIVTAMCTDPGIVSPAACGFVTVEPCDSDAVVIDAYAEMPGRDAPPEHFGNGERVSMAYGGGMETIVGYGAVAVPGIWAGLEEASQRYGAIPWEALFGPALAAVEAGFPLSPAAAEYMAYSHEVIFGLDPVGSAVLHHPDGSHLGSGDIIHMPDLADALRLLAAEGARAVYEGDIGAAIASATQEHGGLITRSDLTGYRAVVREPVRFDLSGWEVVTNSPPAVGGATMAAITMLAAGAGFTGWSAGTTATVAGFQHAVLDYRRHRLTKLVEVPPAVERLLDAARAGDVGRIVTSPSTSHTSATDTDGNACAITVSAGYSAGVVAPGTGMWLNNSLGELELHPAGYHGLPPGTRLISNMAPTAARSSGAVLAIGSPGADRITTAISSVLLNFIEGGMSLSDAIDHPRLHAELFDGQPTIAHEPGLPTPRVAGMVVRRFPDLSMYFGGVQATIFDRAAGLFAHADPRRSGGTARGG